MSRFRNSKRKFKCCPLCGYQNSISNELQCVNTLIAVEYIDVEERGEFNTILPPSAGGHGHAGPFGHYTGYCLCSPNGCRVMSKECIPNPFFNEIDLNANQNVAIVSVDHIQGFFAGKTDFTAGQLVFVKPAEPTISERSPLLWRDGSIQIYCFARLIYTLFVSCTICMVRSIWR